MYPMRRLTPSGSRPTSRPPTTAVPDVGRSRPHSMRMVVDLPAPLLPRNPKISPARTSNETSLTATKLPKRRVRWSDLNRRQRAGAHRRLRSSTQGAREARFGQTNARQRARAIELGLQERKLGVEHLDLRDDTCAIALGDDALRFGRRSNAIVGGSHRRLARIDLQERCRTSTASTESNSASRCRAASARLEACATSAPTRPPSHSDQVRLTPASHESSHRSDAGKDARIRSGVVHACQRRRPAAVAAAAAVTLFAGRVDAPRERRRARWRDSRATAIADGRSAVADGPPVSSTASGSTVAAGVDHEAAETPRTRCHAGCAPRSAACAGATPAPRPRPARSEESVRRRDARARP